MLGLSRLIGVEVQASTFPRGFVPRYLNGLSGVDIDMDAALLLLGTVTVPGGFSQASPARFWAWIRYLCALTPDPDLRITQPFAELDPHQMGVLSDDFGVAVSTQFMFDRLGGFQDIVDGRRFLLQYAHLLGRPVTKKPKKMGPGKCPDFVILDHSGKWHVLECKGTQSGKNYLTAQMGKNAVRQKQVIEIKPVAKGTQLVSGVYISNKPTDSSLIRIKDPPTDAPVVTIGSRRGKSAMTAIRRLATSRALGLAGFYELADELSLPPEMTADTSAFYFPGERRRFEASSRDRWKKAIAATRDRVDGLVQSRGANRISRQIVLEIPGSEFRAATGQNQVRVTVGIDSNFVEQIGATQSDEPGEVDELSKHYLSTGIEKSSDSESVTIREGNLLFARMEFT